MEDVGRIAGPGEPFDRRLKTHELQPAFALQQLRAAAGFDATARLASLAQVPTIVVSAAQDKISSPRYGRALANAIGGARYIEFSDAGRALPIERAEEVNALLLSHFSGADTAAAA